jgi:hypothetical protein
MYRAAKKAIRAARRRIADEAVAVWHPEVVARYRTLSAECLVPDILFNILPDKKLIYIEVPKAACTTIKLALRESMIGPLSGNPMRIHRRKYRLPSIRDVGLVRFFALVDDPGTTIFAFVRDPCARLISYYRDKILPRRFGDKHACPSDAPAVFGSELKKLDPERPMPFDMFIEMATATCATTNNGHWSLMDRIIPTRSMTCNLIGRVEQFDRDFQPIADLIGSKSRLPRHNASRKGSPDIGDWLQGSLKAKVLRAYERDFQRFGYPM